MTDLLCSTYPSPKVIPPKQAVAVVETLLQSPLLPIEESFGPPCKVGWNRFAEPINMWPQL